MPISEKGLQHISSHKYNGRDDSLLYNYVLFHWNNLAIKLIPIWLAPNAVTLIGFVTLLVSFACVAYYSPFMYGAMPNWVYLFSAFCLFVYQTMDNLDGKQARRTQSSSPLGELVDHGCDALVVTIQSLVAASIANCGPGFLSLLFLAMLMLTFWFATWETHPFHTGVLHLRIINGPEEGIAILIWIFIATAYFGSEIWNTGWKTLLGVVWLPIYDFPLNSFFVLLLSLPCVATGALNIYNVLAYLRAKGRPTLPAIQHLITFSLFLSAVFGWYLCSTNFATSVTNPTLPSNSTILSSPPFTSPSSPFPSSTVYQNSRVINYTSVWLTHPRLTQGAMGIAFGELLSRLILQHLAGEPYPLIPRPLIPILSAGSYAIFSYLLVGHVAFERALLYITVLLAFAGYASFVTNTVQQICGHLKISFLRIPHKNKSS